MVSGWDRYGPEYTPPKQRWSWRMRVTVFLVFVLSFGIGAWLAKAHKYGTLWLW